MKNTIRLGALAAVSALALAAWIVAPDAPPVGIALIAAGFLQALRLARWKGWRTIAEPLVLILHLGFLWLPIGLVLMGGGLIGAGVPRAAAIHALTAGAMATMILAVMTRATLGHTGRELKANAPTIALYLLVTLGALLRVAAPFLPVNYVATLRLSAAAWSAAFALFLMVYGPILVGPNSGTRPSQ